ncbi:MAG: hypothetical protein KME08_07680 [Aphanothece sp. CMT-3BRIN-NPC111]|nr:hypothetical protein [Aphanothece sp. CMT-3BRIN-NPC111]
MNAQNLTVRMGGGIVFILIACSNTLASGSIHANSIAAANTIQITTLPPAANQYRQPPARLLSANYSNYPSPKDLYTSEHWGDLVAEDLPFTKLTEDTASDLIWQLPEVQQKAKEITDSSHNVVTVGVMVSELPTVNQLYYTVQVYESHPDHIVTIWDFRVDGKTSAISVQDVATGDYIPLSNWRKLQSN